MIQCIELLAIPLALRHNTFWVALLFLFFFSATDLFPHQQDDHDFNELISKNDEQKDRRHLFK